MSNKEVFALVCYLKMHILVAYSSDSYTTSRKIFVLQFWSVLQFEGSMHYLWHSQCNSAIQHFWIVWKCDCYLPGVFMA